MNIFMPFIYISVIGAIVLFRISAWGKKRGYYKKGQESFCFDKIMHFFGGFLVAMFWSGLTDYFLLVIPLTLLVGVFWEIWEYFYGIYKFKKSGTKENMIEARDTIEDLICDIMGAVAFLFFVYKF